MMNDENPELIAAVQQLVEVGRELAYRRCVFCHVVDPPGGMQFVKVHECDAEITARCLNEFACALRLMLEAHEKVWTRPYA